MKKDLSKKLSQCSRREFVSYLFSIGLMGGISFFLKGCIIHSGIRKITGEVTINGEIVNHENLKELDQFKVKNDSTVITGSNGSIIFTIGRDAFLLRKNSRLKLKPSKNSKQLEIEGFYLHSGAILSVFSKKRLTLRTITAVIGIKGTGVYIEADAEKTYVCTCYGTSHLQVNGAPEVSQTVTTRYHDQPRLIYSGEFKRIDPAPVLNHSDHELTLLENLVGRIPPFKKRGNESSGNSY